MKAGLTPFGQRCRELRTRFRLTMADQARGTSLSVSYVSLIERGMRPIPEMYPEQVAQWMSLSEGDADQLRHLASAEVKSTSEERSAIAEEIAREVLNLPLEKLHRLRTIVSASTTSSYGPSQISAHADLARSVFNPRDKAFVDIVQIVENCLALVDPNFSLHINPDIEFRGDVEAYSDSDGKAVTKTIVSERLYTTAERGSAHSRYVLAHEFAHWYLHRKNTHAFFQRRLGKIASKHVRIEREADSFAREFLMPVALVQQFDTAKKLANAVGVPEPVAMKRIAEVHALTGAFDRGTESHNARQPQPSQRSTAIAVQSEQAPPPQAKILIFPRTSVVSVRRKSTKRAAANNETGDLFEYAEKVERMRLRPKNRSEDWYDEFGWR